MSLTKECPRCHKTKPVAEFSSSKTTKDGLQSACKACAKVYRDAHKEKHNDYCKTYYQKQKTQPKVETPVKICSTCAKEKLSEEFYSNKSTKDGLQASCKKCCNATQKKCHATRSAEKVLIQSEKAKNYRLSRLEHFKEQDRQRYIAKYEENRQRRKRYRQQTRKHRLTQEKIYRENNPEYSRKHSLLCANRRKIATPPWADKKEIKAIYHQCKALIKNTGDKYHVDHIDPVTHPLICGLNVPENLQILSAEESFFKSNYFRPYGVNKDGQIYVLEINFAWLAQMGARTKQEF